ncbi:AraC family ligand binding domain-containing protein [Granulicatella sp. zg-84]|uniref:AraC family ligand binding domain-containing protein n=1 Tax=Granulicatella sp. zg-84 TaxID=2678503 RepID=UPI00196897F0|nr:AraC family ligand binding domain-containing protein [Granulicatella sp. zg-84]
MTIGNIANQAGVCFSFDTFKTVKKVLAKSEKIDRHNHIGHQIVFVIVKGSVTVLLDGQEEHLLTPGTVLTFNGEHTIEAEANEHSEIFVTLIKE